MGVVRKRAGFSPTSAAVAVSTPRLSRSESGGQTEEISFSSSSEKGWGPRIVVGVVVALLALLAALIGAVVAVPGVKEVVVDFFPEQLVFAVEDRTGWRLSPRGFRRSDLEIFPQDAVPEKPVSFSVHFVGNGSNDGFEVTSSEYNGLDEMIEKLCIQMEEAEKYADDPKVLERVCKPSKGARLFTHTGRRVFSFFDVDQGQRTYLVPQGLNFVWPLVRVGEYFFPEAVESPIPGKPIRLRQLSMSPRVFMVENFVSPEEIEAILDHNRDLLKPSEVGFAGWRDSTRTSSTAWDFHSWAARKIQRRSFDLLGLDFDKNMADALQVLRYNISEHYKPHTDYFNGKAFDNHDPTANNGTNRFATVFLYLSDVDQGGHTVFPLSTTHEGYNGEQLVHPGTENTPGYIAQKDSEWCCNTQSTALRSTPKAGNAVLFYSQHADGSLDKYSLHGGCPVIQGVKYSANVWVWNRPKPRKDAAKDGKPAEVEGIQMRFHNTRPNPVSLFWDDGSEEGVFQNDIDPGMQSPMTTYHGHRFFARDKATGKEIFSFTATDNMKGKDHIETID